MSASAQLTYQEWHDSRVRHVKLAGIDIRWNVVSTGILDKCGPDLHKLLNQIDDMHRRINEPRKQPLPIFIAALSPPPAPVPTRREFALAMRKALKQLLPKVLDSPDWLPGALGDFSESEIIELYNAVMHGTGAPAAVQCILTVQVHRLTHCAPLPRADPA